MITKGERTELRSVVRNQFKVLRGEVLQRQAELVADAEARIAGRFVDRDRAREGIEWRIREIVEETNRAIADTIKNSGEETIDLGAISHVYGVAAPRVAWASDNREQMRRAVHAEITSRVKDAMLRLDRQEADLLRNLAVGALESEEARAFLSAIPSVSELVPGDRLAELEAQFVDGSGEASGG